MSSKRPNRRKRKPAGIHRLYRRLLRRPSLTAAEIEAMRKHVILLARTICEHVWGKRFY